MGVKQIFLLLAFFLISFLLASISSALSISSNPQSTINNTPVYLGGQTFIVKIEANFINALTKDSISFYSGRKIIPMVYDVSKLGEKYIIYAVLPLGAREYTLKILDAKYFEQGVEKKETIYYNFTASEAVADFSVSPGFIITNNDFSVNLQNRNSELLVSSEFNGLTNSISIPAGKTKEQTFSISGISSASIAELKLSSLNMSYSIPVLVLKSSNESSNNESPTVSSRKISFTRENVKVEMGINQQRTISFFVENLNNESLKNISLIVSDSLKDSIALYPSKISLLEQEKPLEISIDLRPKTIGNANGTIKAVVLGFDGDENYSDTLNIYLSVSNERIEEPNITDSWKPSCYELGGKICYSTETCDGTVVESSEQTGECCTGTCEANSSSSGGSGKIIIIALIIVVLIVVIYFYRKFRKTKNSTDDILRKKEKSFEEKFNVPSSAAKPPFKEDLKK